MSNLSSLLDNKSLHTSGNSHNFPVICSHYKSVPSCHKSGLVSDSKLALSLIESQTCSVRAQSGKEDMVSWPRLLHAQTPDPLRKRGGGHQRKTNTSYLTEVTAVLSLADPDWPVRRGLWGRCPKWTLPWGSRVYGLEDTRGFSSLYGLYHMGPLMRGPYSSSGSPIIPNPVTGDLSDTFGQRGPRITWVAHLHGVSAKGLPSHGEHSTH